MTERLAATGLELRTLIDATGRLELSLAEVPVVAPGPDEIVVRIEAAPINPSDLGLLLGPVDLATFQAGGTANRPVATATVPADRLTGLSARIGESMPVGNEGAGTVVAAGDNARHLMGRTVAAIGGAMYSQFRTLKAAACLVLPEGTTAAEGASAFVNPLTALSMVESLRVEGHTALVHTAAASNLGQMLNRVCIADGVGLVNIVRSPAQVALVTGIGAVHVCDSSAPDFMDRLTDAIASTGATLAFDAIGGGPLAGQILVAMEAAINRSAGAYSRYGSSVYKQVNIYGALDPRPSALDRRVGMAWGVSGWLLTPFLARIGSEASGRLRARVLAELTTTFASAYAAEVSLAEALSVDAIRAYGRPATGSKYLINPSKGL